MEKLLAFIPAKKGIILDVACGLGATTRHVLRYYAPSDMVGINIAEAQLRMSRVNAPDCTFIQMDAVNLGFRDSVFDNVICVEKVRFVGASLADATRC
jgi:MPBQ/MSBQ methyltransferase